MRRPVPPVPSRAFRTAVAAGLAAALGACATQRKAKSDVRTSFGFDPGAWAGAAGGDDSDEIRSRFAESGWKVDETGQIRPEREEDANLYRGLAIDRGRDVKKKDARLTKREAEASAFRTPDYLERQQFRTKPAPGVDGLFRQGDFDGHRADESGRRAPATGKPGFLSGLNPFKSREARESGRAHPETGSYREATRAQENAAVATGVTQADLGFYKDSVRTMDDVKRLLNPEAFD